MTSTIQFATLATAAYAAIGTTVAGTITSVQARRESRATWERDGVTERYLGLLQAVHRMVSFVGGTLTAMYDATPVGDVAKAWDDLRRIQYDMVGKILEAGVVARPATRSLLAELMTIEIAVFCPHGTQYGVPPIAMRRSKEERNLLQSYEGWLTLAMRVDLGLASRAGKRTWRARFPVSPPDERSVSRSTDPAALRKILREYQVVPLVEADVDFRISGSALSGYQLPMPGLRRPLAGLLSHHGDALRAAIHDPLPADEELETLQAMVRFVERGLRGQPQRDTPTGGRVAVWERRS